MKPLGCRYNRDKTYNIKISILIKQTISNKSYSEISMYLIVAQKFLWMYPKAWIPVLLIDILVLYNGSRLIRYLGCWLYPIILHSHYCHLNPGVTWSDLGQQKAVWGFKCQEHWDSSDAWAMCIVMCTERHLVLSLYIKLKAIRKT